jgi:prepilin-type N-terminal cleavage/methylation domain-containing protein
MLRSPSPPRRARAGFTLVELLVVIAIIAVLAGLLLSAVQTARQKIAETQVKADFEQLGQSLSVFKEKFKRYPPCTGGGPMGTFRLASYYQTRNATTGAITYVTGYSDASPEIVALRAIFGRINLLDNGLRRGAAAVAPDADMNGESDNLQSAGVLPTAPALLDPNQLMVFFLSGGSYNEYLGFATSPTMPFSAPASTPGGQRLGGTPFYDVSRSRDRLMTPVDWLNFRQRYVALNALPNTLTTPMNGTTAMYRWEGAAPNDDTILTVSNEPWFLDPWGTPYLYLAATGLGTGGDYPAGPILIGPWGGAVSGYNRTAANQLPNAAAYAAFPAVGMTPFHESANKFTNHNGVQIISAGPNGSQIRNDRPWGFGRNTNTTGPATYGGGDYGRGNTAGGDDYANFRDKAFGVTD